MTLRDAEVIELLADRPELLAIADAVAATQKAPARPRRRRRIAVRAALVAAAVAAVLVGVLAAPQSQPAILGRALAAIGGGPIMHVVTESPSGIVYVDLKTGRRTAPVLREELWVDRQGDRLHLVVSEDGRVLGDLLLPQDARNGATSGAPAPAFAALWTGYRAALADGTAKLAGRGSVDGRSVYWLRFEPPSQDLQLPRRARPTTEVAVDARTYKPVVFRTSANGRNFDQRILLAKAIAYDAADFERRGRSLVAGSSSGSSTSAGIGTGTSNPFGPPSTVVRAPWLTAGRTVAGLDLRAANVLTATTNVAGKRIVIKGMELVYGQVRHGLATPRSTTVDELRRPDGPSWRNIPAGSVRIETGEETSGNGSRSHTVWTGYLKRNGLFVTISTWKSERALVAIARSLRPAGAR